MRKILLAAALLAAAPLSAVAAEGLSYTYVEGGWTQLQLDRNGAPSKPKLDGGYVRGSFAIAEQVHVFGAYSTVSKTNTYDLGSYDVRVKQELKQPELGIGYHMPMSDRVDFTTDIAWLRINNEAKYEADGFDTERFKEHTNAARATLGVRGKPSPRTEAWLKAVTSTAATWTAPGPAPLVARSTSPRPGVWWAKCRRTTKSPSIRWACARVSDRAAAVRRCAVIERVPKGARFFLLLRPSERSVLLQGRRRVTTPRRG